MSQKTKKSEARGLYRHFFNPKTFLKTTHRRFEHSNGDFERSNGMIHALKLNAQQTKLCRAALGATKLQFVRDLKRWKSTF